MDGAPSGTRATHGAAAGPSRPAKAKTTAAAAPGRAGGAGQRRKVRVGRGRCRPPSPTPDRSRLLTHTSIGQYPGPRPPNAATARSSTSWRDRPPRFTQFPRSLAAASRRSCPGRAGDRAARPNRPRRDRAPGGARSAPRRRREAAPTKTATRRTVGSSRASGRRQNASKNPSSQSPGVAIRSTRVRPPSACARRDRGKTWPLDLERLG